MEIASKDKSAKVADRFSKVVKAHPLISAIILCGLFFVLALVFCDPKYESNDDFFADVILSGGMTGKPDVHVLFSNILLGYLFKGIYSIIPSISFYFVFLVLLGLISSVIIVWLIMKNCRPSIGLLVSIVFLTCFSDDLFILIQFTKAASAALAAGGFLFLEGIWNGSVKHRKAAAVSGVVLFVLGSMLRLSCIYCVILFLFIRFISFSIHKPVKKIIFNLVLCMLLLGSCFGLQKVNDMIWNSDPEYKYYKDLDSLRYPITDYELPEYDVIKPELDEIGISKVDYCMAIRWGFTDLSVFSPDVLEKLNNIKDSHTVVQTSSFFSVFNDLQERMIWFYPGALGLLIVSVLFALYDKKSMFTIFASLLTCMGLIIGFAYLGRLVYRVEFSVLFCAFSVIAVSLGGNPRKLAVRQELFNLAVGIVIVAVTLFHVGIYIPDKSYKTLDDEEYPKEMDVIFGARGYHQELYNAVVNKRRPHESLLTYMENDEHFFLVDVQALMNIYLDFKPWLRPDYKSINCHDVGGCFMMQYPAENYVYEMNGVDPVDPYKSLVNDNIYVVDNYFYLVKLAYIREHYYPDAQIELVGEKSGCMIWNYYIPD